MYYLQHVHTGESNLKINEITRHVIVSCSVYTLCYNTSSIPSLVRINSHTVYRRNVTTQIDEVFGGKMCSIVICRKCCHVSDHVMSHAPAHVNTCMSSTIILLLSLVCVILHGHYILLK